MAKVLEPQVARDKGKYPGFVCPVDVSVLWHGFLAGEELLRAEVASGKSAWMSDCSCCSSLSCLSYHQSNTVPLFPHEDIKLSRQVPQGKRTHRHCEFCRFQQKDPWPRTRIPGSAQHSLSVVGLRDIYRDSCPTLSGPLMRSHNSHPFALGCGCEACFDQ